MDQTPVPVRPASALGQQGVQQGAAQQQHNQGGMGHRLLGSEQQLHTPSDLGASPGEGDEDDMMVSTPQT